MRREMIYFLVSLIIIPGASLWAQLTIVSQTQKEIGPGEMVEVVVKTSEPENQSVLTSSWMKTNPIDEKAYFLDVQNWRSGTNEIVATATMVFRDEFDPIKILKWRLPSKELNVKFEGFLFNPQNKDNGELEFIEVPLMQRIEKDIRLILGFLVLIILVALGKPWVSSKLIYLKNKRQIKLKIKNLKESIKIRDPLELSSQMWLERDEYKILFKIEEHSLRSFFDFLISVQFRPNISQEEKETIRVRLTDFLEKIGKHYGV